MALFVLTTFLGAGLLFAVEPMVAKMLLPRLGGSPAVWNTAMVFFQAALLAGYAFAHFSTTLFGLRRHPWVQVAVIASAILLLPIGIDAGWRPPDGVAPALWTLLVLLVIVGGPFFVLATASPTLEMIVGDGRLELAATEERYDLIVLDAFSSDAIPVHLMTREALAIYRERLNPGGVVAFHVSNNYLDLVPVVARLADDADLVGLEQRDIATSTEKAAGKTHSNWVLLATGRDDLALVGDNDDWRRLGDGDGAPLWTDSFSDVVSVLKF